MHEGGVTHHGGRRELAHPLRPKTTQNGMAEHRGLEAHEQASGKHERGIKSSRKNLDCCGGLENVEPICRSAHDHSRNLRVKV